VSSRFGRHFQISTFGESHGGGVGVVLDGCPPRLPLAPEEVQRDLERRRPGQSRLTTPRQEEDRVEILSGVFEGHTLGTPIAMLVRNRDARPGAYEHMKDLYRPSHADYTTEAKYGIRNWQGGGRSSARETVGRVAAGAVARKLLLFAEEIEVLAWVRRVQDVEAKVDPDSVTLEAVESNLVRCPESSAAAEMIQRIDAARERVGERVALQGNLDPCVLYADPDTIRAKVREIIQRFGNHPGHVFNLGHGIHQTVNPDHLGVLVDAVHEYGLDIRK